MRSCHSMPKTATRRRLRPIQSAARFPVAYCDTRVGTADGHEKVGVCVDGGLGETRERLEAAALRLFLQRGYERVTVGEIADAAGVSPRTFFRYFSSKAQVVFARQSARVGALQAALVARPPGEPVVASVHAALSELAEVYAEQRDLDLVRLRIVSDTPALTARSAQASAEMEAVIVSHVAERLGVDPVVDLRPAIAAAATIGALRVAVEHWTSSGGLLDLSALVEEALALVRADYGLSQVA